MISDQHMALFVSWTDGGEACPWYVCACVSVKKGNAAERGRVCMGRGERHLRHRVSAAQFPEWTQWYTDTRTHTKTDHLLVLPN